MKMKSRNAREGMLTVQNHGCLRVKLQMQARQRTRKTFKTHQLHAGQDLCSVGCIEGYICVPVSVQTRYLSLVSAQGVFQEHPLAALLATHGCYCLLLGAVLLQMLSYMPTWKHTVKLDTLNCKVQLQNCNTLTHTASQL